MGVSIKTTQITSLSEYSKYLEQDWDIDDVLFRGQQIDKPLLPKLGRLKLEDDIPTVEERMLEDFKIQSPPFLQFNPANDWEWLALAQHHGMPTRLLDWTANPLAALWFAVERAPEEDQPGVVWIFETSRRDYVQNTRTESPFSGARTKVFRPRHLARRIVAQAGWFTVHKYHDNRDNFIALENNKAYRPKLTKVVIPAASFTSIRWELDRWGFNAAHIYADLDGLCRHIQWYHSLLADEKE
jgi:hypothetical protein